MPPASVARAPEDSTTRDRLGPLRQIAGTDARRGYSSALAELWTDLLPTLRELDWLASGPELNLEDESCERLARLQYALHTAEEDVAGLRPPHEAQSTHEELAAALADARDATAEIAYLVETDEPESVSASVYGWRGALFRVRLAQLGLADPEPGLPELPAEPDGRRSGYAWALVGGGALVLAVGALAGLWEIAGLGLAAFAAGALTSRP
jgi:hypothetical protein